MVKSAKPTKGSSEQRCEEACVTQDEQTDQIESCEDTPRPSVLTGMDGA